MKISIFSLFMLIIPHFAVASIQERPRDFTYIVESGQNYKIGQATFVDFVSAATTITINSKTQEVSQATTIELDQLSDGQIVLDFVPSETSIYLDGKSTQLIEVVTPGHETLLKVVADKSLKGHHTLVITSKIQEGLTFTSGLSLRFRFIDLKDRNFLERYLPTNLEYDQYSMSITVDIVDRDLSDFQIATNGAIRTQNARSIVFDYPDYYSCSSLFFHVTERSLVNSDTQNFNSIDGRKIPVFIYKLSSEGNIQLDDFFQQSFNILSQLEADYGPYPHSTLTIFANSYSNMEYSGAFSANLSSLKHELFHQYLGRFAMPANGNAGWIDEAFVKWFEASYPSSNLPNYDSSDIGATGIYARATHFRSYSDGLSFIKYLNYKTSAAGKSLRDFLKMFILHYKKQTYTTTMFRSDLEQWSGLQLKDDFNKYVYGVQ